MVGAVILFTACTNNILKYAAAPLLLLAAGSRFERAKHSIHEAAWQLSRGPRRFPGRAQSDARMFNTYENGGYCMALWPMQKTHRPAGLSERGIRRLSADPRVQSVGDQLLDKSNSGARARGFDRFTGQINGPGAGAGRSQPTWKLMQAD